MPNPLVWFHPFFAAYTLAWIYALVVDALDIHVLSAPMSSLFLSDDYCIQRSLFLLLVDCIFIGFSVELTVKTNEPKNDPQNSKNAKYTTGETYSLRSPFYTGGGEIEVLSQYKHFMKTVLDQLVVVLFFQNQNAFF